MKRIVLGISVLLLLVQNGFAKEFTNAEYDKEISKQTTEVWKQIWRCNKAKNNRNSPTSDVNICLKSIEMQKAIGIKEKDLAIDYLNTGVIYDHQSDKLNAYKYYMKAAKLGNIKAQKNLTIMCKESPWACK